ncbi:HNH endonuclease domain-containing protein [[Clostridium] sordellii]|uniref:HNH endonuclease n=1 Tax=Paraclostridium sordellii TaxID=1505 RepID=A0ABP1XWP4_PARSO|nr:hypothetical protein [Paeniclostridium sordellii]EPZ54726.1 HNH endonuclease family protein [[Clostridium] sordellii ATCC 9714] [Paeniclostridium sordellii ATCC 9714]CEJ74237.1 hypothetical protein ATCC9714_21251 [[Clostridium] sordellii] [Paeniclostridium sordellii]CEN69779.1 HNH endonuclease domain-containing protein [[Clostridium] sordellii] [Paeniclostridium sordellii]CEN73047.1 HNH endonuclease domain-containing protein [[Clostridium] sordellii] [Paeniclostridium sordellii]CEO25629.1 H
MLKKFCRCGKIISQSKSRCDKCESKYINNKRKSYKVYNSKNRNKNIDAFYHTDEWEEKRIYILIKYNYVDLWDFFVNGKETTEANTVHHIVEVTEDYEQRLDNLNLIPVSTKSHNKIHSLYRKDKESTQKKLRDILEKAENLFCNNKSY